MVNAYCFSRSFILSSLKCSHRGRNSIHLTENASMFKESLGNQAVRKPPNTCKGSDVSEKLTLMIRSVGLPGWIVGKEVLEVEPHKTC